MLEIERHLSKMAAFCGFRLEGERGCVRGEELQKHIDQQTGGAIPMPDLLPYDYFDDNTNIFFNRDGTCGFWYEINPLVGSSDDIEKNLTLFFNDELPEGSYLQFLIIAGHDISNILKLWEEGRKYGGKRLKDITAYRKWFIERCSKDFAASRDGRLARNFRTFVTYSCPDKKTNKFMEQLLKFQKKLENKLRTEKLSPEPMRAEDLIVIGRTMLQMQMNETSKASYSPINNMADQICLPLTPVTVNPECIKHEGEGLESRLFFPKELPKSFSLSRMILLLGGNDKTIPARFIISYTLAANLGVGGTSRLVAQGHRSIHAAEMAYTRNDISAREQASQWREVLDRHKKGERFLSESMSVMITAPYRDIDIAEEALKSLWNSEDWKLAINTDLQLVALLTMLPMAGCGMWKSLSFFKLTRFALSGDVVAKLPIQGEWKGVPQSGVLLMGRRGQLFNFNPFFRIGGGGNYNISLMAPTGSGKSFLLQDLALSMIDQDIAVFVMDIGGSYKEICSVHGGEMVRFNKANKTSLNPFATLSNSGAVYAKALELLGQNMLPSEIAEITDLSLEKIEALAIGKSDVDSTLKEQDGIEVLEINSINLLEIKKGDKKGKAKTYFVTKDSIVYAKAMLSSMCGINGDARCEAIIERAINIGIATHGTDLDITKLTEILENLKDRRGEPVEGAARLSDSLYPYTEDGIH